MESPLERKLVWTEKQLEQLRTENAALKEQVAQQAAVIEQMREWFTQIAEAYDDLPNGLAYVAALASLALQPSSEVLDQHDAKVAEACAKLVNRFISGDGILNDTWVHEIEDALRSGEWRKYL